MAVICSFLTWWFTPHFVPMISTSLVVISGFLEPKISTPTPTNLVNKTWSKVNVSIISSTKGVRAMKTKFHQQLYHTF
ncbi:hypothetical protein HanPSC8_Chr08g0343181 [Helianthus annuus]|nr:hypothetical protein HanPSC8_Chr08g0343181 [Helianthus annuus]